MGRRTKEAPLVHLITCVILVCLSIYIWTLFGCLGLSECYLCRNFTPDRFFHETPLVSPTDDFTRLMNLSNFTFLINNFPCDHDDLILVLVHSAPHNYDRRSAIRDTWGKLSNWGDQYNNERFKLLFLLGIPATRLGQTFIEMENDEHRDLVQGNFLDTYRNLTYKHVMALKWTKYFCPRAKYLLKTDDDIFVNSPNLLHYVDQYLPREGLIRCSSVNDARAQRSSRSKWRVTWSEYNFRLYPTYCWGFAILYSRDVVLALYDRAQTASYFWIDDVFVTGFLAMSVNVTVSSFGRLVLDMPRYRRLMTTKRPYLLNTYLLGPWSLNVRDMRTLAEKTKWIRVEK